MRCATTSPRVCVCASALLLACASDTPAADAEPDSGTASTSASDGGSAGSASTGSSTVGVGSGASDDGSSSSGTDPGELFEVGTESRTLLDRSRDRNVGVRFYYPIGSVGVHALVTVSNGELGEPTGEDKLPHLGQRAAQRGMVAITVGHTPSTGLLLHREDRPQDVSFVLDSIESGALAMPEAFEGTVDVSRVGHTGHSAGAYTTHALVGATYPYGTFRDPRIAAAVPISPQGVGDFFEGFDNGPGDNTWATVATPIMMLVGSDEIDVNGIGLPQPPGWRLQPWERYPEDLDRMMILVPGQDHKEMGNFGSPEVSDYLAETVADFFFAYLAGTGDACGVGTRLVPPDIAPSISHAPGTSDTLLDGCS